MDIFFTKRKLESRRDELRGFRYRDVVRLEEFVAQEDTQGVVNPEVPLSFDG